MLQTARDSLLVHERLLKEIQKKEILLHCIIHDLSQPLTAMRGCFDVLAHETASPGFEAADRSSAGNSRNARTA